MIAIEQVNYFSKLHANVFNTTVLYRKYGKLYLARVYVDFFNKRVHVPKQEKDAKALAGFEKAINEFAEKTDWRLA